MVFDGKIAGNAAVIDAIPRVCSLSHASIAFETPRNFKERKKKVRFERVKSVFLRIFVVTVLHFRRIITHRLDISIGKKLAFD